MLTRSGILGGAQVAAALSQLKQKVMAGTTANIVAIGDSTGDATTEWIYGFAAYLAATFPANTTTYRLYNNAGSSWPAATNIATGGAGPVEFWNASIAGTQPTYLLGSRRAASIDGMPAAADLVIINHGLNSAAYVYSYSPRAQLMSLIEACKLKWPDAPILIVNENPQRDDDLMAAVNTAWLAIEALYPDVAVLNVYDTFIAASKASTMYADNIHPSTPYSTAGKGQNVIYELMKTAWNNSSASLLITPSVAFLSQNATNLLSNGDFSAFAGATPDGWTGAASVTITKDMGVVDPLYGTYSVKLEGSAAFQSLDQAITGANLTAIKAAGACTLAARVYVAAGSGSSAGTIGTTVTAFPIDALETSVAQIGGWMWLIAPSLPVPSNATGLEVNLYRSTSASALNVSHFSRAILVAGASPRNMA